MKDRLIELLEQHCLLEPYMTDCTASEETECSACLANFLLNNGIIVPPCKVGDTVYIIAKSRFTEQYKVLEKSVLEMAYKHEKWWIVVNEYPTKLVFGDRVFLNPEAAEKALKERENNA